MSPTTILTFVWAIASKVVEMLLKGEAPATIGETVAAEAAAFYTAQRLADEKTKQKFPDYEP